MADWWWALPFRRQVFIIIAAAVGAAIVVLEFLVEPLMEINTMAVTGGIDWHEGPVWLFMILVAAAAVVAILTRIVIQRLRLLSQATDELIRGNFTYRMKTRGNSEDIFNKLALNFNSMAKTIDDTLHNEQRLLSDISHELRSPLTRMRAAIELLLISNTDNGNTKFLRKVDNEIAQMSQLVDILLGQSRGRIAMRGGREVIDVSTATMEMADSFQLQGVTQRKELTFDITPDVYVEGHPMQIRLIIENLLSNALFFSPPNTRVEVRLSCTDGSARLSIRDFGSGIPEEYLVSIFRPFFRIDPSRSRHSGGVGLGLSLVQEACEAIGGTIEAKNTQPGLEVTVLLPLARSPSSC